MNSVQPDSVVRAEQKLLEAELLRTQEAHQDLDDERKRRTFLVASLVSVIVGVVGYFVSGVYGMRLRYPSLFRWYEAMRREKVQGKGRHNYSLYEVCTAANFAAAHQLFNMLLIWKALHPAAANFLLFTVEYFGEKALKDPKMTLTALHWAGSRDQTGYDRLVGPTGWASTGCAEGRTLEEKQEALIRNWNAGAEQNIWYPLLPQPVDETSKRAFLSVPMIAELFSDSSSTGGAASACDPQAFAMRSKLGQLYDGGLCNVAFEATRDDQSAADLFNSYFSVHANPTASESCDGAASAGAAQGALSGGAMGTVFLQIAGDLIPGKGAALMFRKVIGTIVVSSTAAVAGGVTSAAAAKERCRRDGGAS